MKRLTISLLTILGLAIATASGVYLLQIEENNTQKELVPLPVPVEVLKVHVQNFTHSLEALGTVRAIREAAISAEITGPIVRIPKGIELGKSVEQGTLLAEIDPTSSKIEEKYREALMARAKAQLKAKKVNIDRQRTLIPINREKLRLGRARHKRLQKLLKNRLVAQQDVEQAELEVRRIEENLEQAKSELKVAEASHAVATADLASTQAELARARKALSDTRVRAPFQGIISEKKITEGEQLAMGQILFRLADIKTVKVRIHVPPDEIDLLRQGTLTSVTVSVFPTKFSGRVEHIGLRADDETRSFPAEVLIKNIGHKRLLPGMFARAVIPIHTYTNIILIPSSSILTDSGAPSVFIVDPEQQTVRLHQITLGQKFGSRHIVKKGLSSGDLLVVAGQQLLKNGADIRIIDSRKLVP